MRLFTYILAALFVSNMALACTDQTPCELNGRSYHVKLPDDWDGVSPMPVMLHFHGWARQGTLIVKHSRISGATRKRGVLLLAPNGRNKTWDFWSPGSPDTKFADAVLADAAQKYPIDLSRVYISGYSYGAAMAWRYVCESETPVAALLSVAGTLDQNEVCDNMPSEVRHVHGTSDTVMDFPFGAGGDTTYPVALWRQAKGCETGQHRGPWSAPKNTFERTDWMDCADGGVIKLDVHERGHFIPVGWFAHHLDNLLGRTPLKTD